MIQTFPKFCIGQIPHNQNMVANLLANLAIHHNTVEQKTVSLGYQDQPYVEKPLVEVIRTHTSSDDWRYPFMEFLLHGTTPHDKREAHKLQTRAFKYVIIEELFYRRSTQGPYLRCLF